MNVRAQPSILGFGNQVLYFDTYPFTQRNPKQMVRNNTLTLSLPDLNHVQALGRCLGESLVPGSILMLEGDLGSGKTTLVQSMGVGLGITDVIASPTFALIHEYPEGRIPLYHFDLYRLESREAKELHLETYWEGLEVPPGIVAIEWPDRLLDWPKNYLHCRLTYADEGREITFTPHGQIDWASIYSNLQLFGLLC